MRRQLWQLATLLLLALVFLGAAAFLSLRPANAQHSTSTSAFFSAPLANTHSASTVPQTSGKSAGVTTQPRNIAAPNVVLYDQYNNPGANSSLSQDFEPANAAFSSQLADD